jgi:hypothetical protein
VNLLSEILGSLFLLSVGIAACIGALSAYLKAKKLYGVGQSDSLQDQHNAAVAKAIGAAAFGGIVWYDSFDLDTAIVRIAVPFGIYKFVQLVTTPVIGWWLEQQNTPVVPAEQKTDG